MLKDWLARYLRQSGKPLNSCRHAEHTLQGGPLAGVVPADAGLHLVHWQAQDQSCTGSGQAA